MSEIIVKMKSDYIKIKSGEYIRDLVRCKDCKHLYQDNECPLRLWFVHTENDYCSYGEKQVTGKLENNDNPTRSMR